MDELLKLTDTPLPFAENIGVKFISATKDKIVAELEVTPELCTVPAILHGGAIMTLATQWEPQAQF
jgi:1,4-dihydroxy-2-naphthoyl-CoA hydrolase